MRIPKNRPPTHPGEVLREDFLKPLGITQERLAEELGVSFQRINGIVNAKRSLTAETALLLAGRFNTSAGFWMNFQTRYDLYQARERLRHGSAISRRYAALVTSASRPLECVGEGEDVYYATKRLEGIRAGRRTTIPLSKVMKRLGAVARGRSRRSA